jgi:hypothetical protein
MMAAHDLPDELTLFLKTTAAIVHSHSRFRGVHPNFQKSTSTYAAC